MFKTNHTYLSNTQIQLLLDVYSALVKNNTDTITPKLRPDTVAEPYLVGILDMFSRRFHFVKRVIDKTYSSHGHPAVLHVFDMEIMEELIPALKSGVCTAQTQLELKSITLACYILQTGNNLYWRAAGDVIGDKKMFYPSLAKEVGYLDLVQDRYRVTDQGKRAVEYWDSVSDILLRKPEPVCSRTSNIVNFKR